MPAASSPRLTRRADEAELRAKRRHDRDVAGVSALTDDAVEDDPGDDLRLGRTTGPEPLVLDEREHGGPLGIEQIVVRRRRGRGETGLRDARFRGKPPVVEDAAREVVQPRVHPVGRVEAAAGG